MQLSTSFLVSIAGANAAGVAFAGSNKSALTIQPSAPTPQILSVAPNQGTQSQTLSVAIIGQNTTFSQAASQVSFGAGVTVAAITVNSATSLAAEIVITATAAPGPRNVSVTTAAQVVTSTQRFQVSAAISGATISSVTPGVGATGSSVLVTVIGSGTAFQQDTSIVSFGAGISPGPLTVSSGTQFSTTLTMASDAAPGPRTVTVTTGSQVVSLADAFAVIGPEITIFSPTDKSFVNTPSITVNGRVDGASATVAVNGVPAGRGGNFTVAIPLSEGNNSVTATATTDSGTTSATSVLVNLDTTPPRVAVLTPVNEDETTEERINVAGNVNDIVVGTVNEVQAQVSVNGIAAEVNNRSFVARNVPLQAGINTLQVVARDRVGNAFTTSVKVNRVMAPLLKLSVISGNNQSAVIDSPLPQPLVVQLTDGLGIPKPNTSVFFRVAGNNGSVAAALGTTGALAIEVKSNAQGQAQAHWTLGSHSGAGVNRVEVGATGVTAPAAFTATGQSAAVSKIVVDSGLNQIGAVGQKLPLPFVAVVIDSGNNRLGGVPVSMTVRSGGGKIEGQDSVTVNSDPDGRAAITLTLGPQEGQENNEIIATFPGNTSASAVFAASGRVPKRVGDTKVTGVVLDGTNQPIAAVTVALLRLHQGASSNLPQQSGPSAVSNAKGYFEIVGAPVGVFKLLVDATKVPGPNKYPTLEFDISTVAGQNNTIGMPVYLPALDTNNQLCVDETNGGTLTLANVPGFALTVAAGSATFPGGSTKGCVSVTPVNIDKVPMTPGFGQQPRFIVTIQPVGTTFNPPAAITIPNMDGLRPREVTEMYSYDHDLASFVAVGTATVSADGSVITSNPGVGVLKAGWHCGGNPNQTGTAANCPECQKCQVSGCVADDSQIPRQRSDGDCMSEVCQNGTVVSVLDDSEESPLGGCCQGQPFDPTTSCCAQISGSQKSAVVSRSRLIAEPAASLEACCENAENGCCDGVPHLKSNSCCVSNPRGHGKVIIGKSAPITDDFFYYCPKRTQGPQQSTNGCSIPDWIIRLYNAQRLVPPSVGPPYSGNPNNPAGGNHTHSPNLE